MNAIILDIETTGTEKAEVIELAWREYPTPEGLPAKKSCARFQPSGEMEFGALATHHILPEELEGCAPSANALQTVPRVEYWIGHNIDFDWAVLGRPPVKRICTLAMARAMWPELDSHSLSAIAYFLGGMTPKVREVLKSAHGAAADVELVRPILRQAMTNDDLTDLESLWRFSEDCRIPKVMSFGKYKGYRIEQVDRGYAQWYSKQGDVDPYLIEAFRRARKL